MRFFVFASLIILRKYKRCSDFVAYETDFFNQLFIFKRNFLDWIIFPDFIKAWYIWYKYFFIYNHEKKNPDWRLIWLVVKEISSQFFVSWYIVEHLSIITKVMTYLPLYMKFSIRPVIKSIEKKSYAFVVISKGGSFLSCFPQITLIFPQIN